jgi:hypothetical protein
MYVYGLEGLFEIKKEREDDHRKNDIEQNYPKTNSPKGISVLFVHD